MPELSAASERDVLFTTERPHKWGPQNRPKYVMILIMKTTKMGPPFVGTAQIGCI